MTKTTKYQPYQEEYDIIVSKRRKSVEENAFQSESKIDVASWKTQSDRKMKLKSVRHLKKISIHPQQSTIKKKVFDIYQKSMDDYRYQYSFDNEREASDTQKNKKFFLFLI